MEHLDLFISVIRTNICTNILNTDKSKGIFIVGRLSFEENLCQHIKQVLCD